jgi:ATP-dependent exoDNAse (exonuclease V) beta subunit
VRAAATTVFFGESAASLHAGGDELTDRIGQTLRTWADHLRAWGVAAVFEAAQLTGMAERVLAVPGGERDMTDLAHLAQLLHETAHRERFGLPALLAWLRSESTGQGRATERTRRLDSDAAAVQIMTVWVSKGMQFPLVYLPFGFNRHVFDDELLLFHENGIRSLDIGGEQSAGHAANKNLWRAEVAGDDIRLTYVALTRAQSQVVAWWAPSWDERNGGVSRLLRGRKQGDPGVPERLAQAPRDDDVLAQPLRWRKPRKVFVNSMSDLFHASVPDEYIAHVWAVMALTQHHTYQILTKRHERLADLAGELPWHPNVWIGVSIENRRFLQRADALRSVPASVRFISAEPLLGPLDGLELESVLLAECLCTLNRPVRAPIVHQDHADTGESAHRE